MLTKAVQDHKVELIKDAAVGPLGEAPPAGRRCEPQPSSRAGSSRQGVEVRAMYTMAARHARSEMVRSVPAAVGWAWWGREQGRDQRPQLLRHEVVSKGRHVAGSCQTNPKGAKRRLSALLAFS